MSVEHRITLRLTENVRVPREIAQLYGPSAHVRVTVDVCTCGAYRIRARNQQRRTITSPWSGPCTREVTP